MENSPILAAALRLAALGWRVIPLHGVTPAGACTCQGWRDKEGAGLCGTPGKHPRFKGFQRQATTDPKTIRKWWVQWPSANLGILTGKESGICVLDGDPRNGGDVSLEALIHKHGRLPWTTTARSGGGGPHYYFLWPDIELPSFQELAEGIEIIGADHVLVAPPSLHPSGKRYEWEPELGPDEQLPVAMPAWLVDVIRARLQPAAPMKSKPDGETTKFPPTEVGPILVGCAWMAHCSDVAATLAEPQWYAQLSILGRCVDGEELAHELSSPHRGYSRTATAAKLTRAISDSGPARCSRIRNSLGGEPYCSTCDHWGKIKSPIVLGMESREEIPLPDEPPGIAAWHTSTKLEPATMEIPQSAKRPRAAGPTADRGASRKGTNTNQLAREITGHAHFAKDAGGRLYVFKAGVYDASGESFIRQQVKRLMGEWGLSHKWASKIAEEVIEYIRVDCRELWAQIPADEINIKSGLLNVVTKKCRPHDAAFLSSIQLPVRFDPLARCPHWDEFVAQVFPEDLEALAWEIVAWIMTPDTSIQKAILLSGEGANGKSVFLRACIAFVGKCNTAAISLQKLEQDKFACSRLVGKLANIVPDLPSDHLTGTSTFKALTGGDVVGAERKYSDQFEFIPFVKLIFSANQPPRSDDATHGFFRRWIVLPFRRTFEEGAAGTRPRSELDAELAEPGELSGVLNKALEALKHIRQHGLSEGASARKAWDEFKQATDPLSVWLDHHTIDDADGVTPKAWMMGAFNRSRADAGLPGMTKSAFGLALRRARKGITDSQRTVRGRLHWCYVGIRLVEEPEV